MNMWLKRGIIGLFILCSCLLILQLKPKPDVVIKDVQQGLSYIQKQEKQDVTKVQKEVTKAQKKLERPKKKKGTYQERYQHSVIIGDSIAEACLDYRILTASVDLAVRGKRTDNSIDQAYQAIALAPEHVFVCLGMNDLIFVRGNEKQFIAQYKELIQTLKKGLPEAKIYVNSILPMTDVGYKQTKHNKKDKVFNREIEKMCEEMDLVYIDNDEIIEPDPKNYEADGIHPTYPFYPLWLDYMASFANI